MYDFTELDIAIENAFGLANKHLKAEYRSKGGSVRSLRVLAKAVGIATKKTSKHRQCKNEKAARVANYRAQLEANPEGDIQYNIDEDMVYRKEIAFVTVAIRAGIIDADDFEEYARKGGYPPDWVA